MKNQDFKYLLAMAWNKTSYSFVPDVLELIILECEFEVHEDIDEEDQLEEGLDEQQSEALRLLETQHEGGRETSQQEDAGINVLT